MSVSTHLISLKFTDPRNNTTDLEMLRNELNLKAIYLKVVLVCGLFLIEESFYVNLSIICSKLQIPVEQGLKIFQWRVSDYVKDRYCFKLPVLILRWGPRLS